MFNDQIKTTSLYLCHHGVKGQKWGVRRYQNEDGSLTNAGRRRYIKGMRKELKRLDTARAREQRIGIDIMDSAATYNNKLQKLRDRQSIYKKGSEQYKLAQQEIDKHIETSKSIENNMASFNRRMKSYNQDIENILKEAKQYNVNVTTKQTSKNAVSLGENLVRGMLGAPIEIMMVSSTKYTVTDGNKKKD